MISPKLLIIFPLVLWTVFTACQSSPAPATAPPKGAQRPNILLIVADDLGWADLNCYGSHLTQTDHLDALARDGVQFMQAYAAGATGTPSRAALQSGLNPDRIRGIEKGLAAEHETIGELARRANYFTAHIGKWGLGTAPGKQGYDRTFAAGNRIQPDSFYYPFFTDGSFPELIDASKPGDYLSDVLTEQALQLMQEWKGQPWLISLNYYAPHVPIQGRKDWVKHYHELIAATHYRKFPTVGYASMISAMDANIGLLVNQLKADSIFENTLIVFTSDNGGLDKKASPDSLAKQTPPTDNGILQGGKGSIYEGGIRVPFIVHYPNATSQTLASNAPVIGMDIYPTLAELFGRYDYSPTPDGQSLLPILQGQEPAPRSFRWAAEGQTATRNGSVKTIIRNDSTFQYDLLLDPSEVVNRWENDR